MGTRAASLPSSLLLGGLICACAAAAGGDYPPLSTPQPASKPFYLITDYLPAAVYDRDSIAGSFRIENTTSTEAKLDFVVTAWDAAGKVIAERTEAVAAPASGFGQCHGSQEAAGCAKIEFAVRKGQEKVGAVTVRLLLDDAAWPVTRIRGGRMEAADNGNLVVPVVNRRAKKEENRAFAPVKWMLGYGTPGPVAPSEDNLVFVPARWDVGGGKPRAGLVVLGPYEPGGAPLALCAASEVFNALEKAGAGKETSRLEQLQICLPPEDLDVGTDPHVYRAVLDAVLAHATSLTLRKVVLVPPFQYGAKAAHYEALRKEVRGAAVAYGAVWLDPADCLEEKLWRVNPAVEGVYGLRPNPAGLKKIEQGLLNLVR